LFFVAEDVILKQVLVSTFTIVLYFGNKPAGWFCRGFLSMIKYLSHGTIQVYDSANQNLLYQRNTDFDFGLGFGLVQNGFIKK
jgi:hypothetical protein